MITAFIVVPWPFYSRQLFQATEGAKLAFCEPYLLPSYSGNVLGRSVRSQILHVGSVPWSQLIEEAEVGQYAVTILMNFKVEAQNPVEILWFPSISSCNNPSAPLF